jgi:hypothetical protein
MENRSKACPFRDETYKGITFRSTDFWPLVDIVDSVNDGHNIWVDTGGKPMRGGIAIYNKEFVSSSWTFVVAFDTEEARNTQIQANASLEWKDTGKYTVPDITTFFEIEKDGKSLYCYLVERGDAWKHKKEMLLWEMDSVSIYGVVVYPGWLIWYDWEIIAVKNAVSRILK